MYCHSKVDLIQLTTNLTNQITISILKSIDVTNMLEIGGYDKSSD